MTGIRGLLMRSILREFHASIRQRWKMNINTISAECAHNCCPECTFEDCACECHAQCDHDKSDLGHVFPTDEHDRAWYEENDPQSLVDSINGNFDPLA